MLASGRSSGRVVVDDDEDDGGGRLLELELDGGTLLELELELELELDGGTVLELELLELELELLDGGRLLVLELDGATDDDELDGAALLELEATDDEAGTSSDDAVVVWVAPERPDPASKPTPAKVSPKPRASVPIFITRSITTSRLLLSHVVRP